MQFSKQNKTYQAYGYVRLSQDDEDKIQESDSISNQKLLIKEYAAKHKDIHLIGFKVDDGCTGVTFDRKGFNELMEIVRSGKCDCIIVKDLSRFGRNYIESGRYIERIFPMLGVRFIAINDLFDSLSSNSLADSMTVPFKNLINDLYSKDISVKVRSHFEVRRQKGDFVGPHIPYGYKRDEKDRGHFVVDDQPAEVVKKIFRMRLDGFSQQAIAEQLNAFGEPSPLEYKKLKGFKYCSGFKARDKSLWSAQTIGRILRNEVYIGTMVQKKVTTINYKVRKPVYLPAEQQIRVQNTHEPIIDERTFALVQQLLKGKQKCIGADDRATYLFSGLLICGQCGSKMDGQTFPYKDKKHVYYLCRHCQKEKHSNRIKQEKLYDLVLHALQSHIYSVTEIERVVKKLGEIPFQKNEIKRVKDQLEQKRQELQKYTKWRQSLHEDYTNGRLSKEEMQDYYQGYKVRCEEAEASIQQLERKMEEIICAKSTDNTWMKDFVQHKNIQELSRRILVNTVSSIKVIDKAHICLVFNFQQQFEEMYNRVRSVLQDNHTQLMEGVKQ